MDDFQACDNLRVSTNVSVSVSANKKSSYEENDATFYVSDWCVYSKGTPNIFTFDVAKMLLTLSQIDRPCLALIRSKCYKIGKGWLFREGAMKF